ncbi:MAG: hypothetical protein ACT4P7_14535 [Gemmatimonadaceae bacterium]
MSVPRIVRMILPESLGLTMVGLVLGTALSVAAIKLSSVVLLGPSPGDPLTLGLAMVILAGSALLAGYLPGRQAAQVDPMEALRAE